MQLEQIMYVCMYVKWKINLSINCLTLFNWLFSFIRIFHVREQGAVTKETQGTGISDAVLIKFFTPQMQRLFEGGAYLGWIFPGNRGGAYSSKYDMGEPMRFQAYIELKAV